MFCASESFPRRFPGSAMDGEAISTVLSHENTHSMFYHHNTPQIDSNSKDNDIVNNYSISEERFLSSFVNRQEP